MDTELRHAVKHIKCRKEKKQVHQSPHQETHLIIIYSKSCKPSMLESTISGCCQAQRSIESTH